MPSPKNRLITLLILFFCTPMAKSQDLTGLWKGYMYNDTTQKNYKYEIAISANAKGKLTGYSHTYFIIDDKEYHGVKEIKIHLQDDKVIVEDVKLIANNYPIAPPKGVRQLNILSFEMKNNTMVLAGEFTTNRTKEYHPVTGYIHVERKINYRESALIPHLEELNLAKNLSFIKETDKPVEETAFVLQPLKTDAEVQAIVFAAQKKQNNNTINTNAPDIKIKPIEIKTAPEPIKEKPIVKNEVKPQPPAVVKETPQPQPVPVAAPPVKKMETQTQPVVAVPKPATPATTFANDPKAATDIANRKVETIQALYFKSDSLTLTLYDNGEVDGDTVSVIMNGKMLMPRVGLSTDAVKKTIYTNNITDSIQLVMYAETLGSLPPNTGLLIVYDGTDRYEIRFSGDMKKSAAIVFKRRK